MTWGDVLQAAIAACMVKGQNAEVDPDELAALITQILGTFRHTDPYSVPLGLADAESDGEGR